MVELQESEEGQGDGGVAEGAPSDLFKNGLSVPESMLERCVWITGGEEDPEDGGGWGGCFSPFSISWILSWWAAWDKD